MGLPSFVALDIETTGPDATLDQIIEIGLVRYELGQEVTRLAQLVDPGCPIALRIQNLTGILPTMVKGKPGIDQLVLMLKELIGELPIVAHNAPFDLGFLRTAFSRAGVSLGNRVYDTAELARIILPRAKNYRLETLVQQLQIELKREHRAEDDARASGQVFLALLDQIKRMELGLLRFVLAVGEPGNWTLAPLFRTELELREAAGEKAKLVTEWIRPYEGQLHQLDEPPSEGEPGLIEPELPTRILGPGGVVSEAFNAYEHRPQQLQMAAAVTEALNGGHHLLIEAGTGTGKSLAYLVPALALAKRSGEKIGISTHTINLQEQLWEKDIPFLEEALAGTELDGFSAALVKGRSNYICLRKWEEEATAADFFTTPEQRAFHMRAASWLSETETGDKSELNLFGEQERLWTDVMSETETCLGSKCKWYRSHCFAYRARRRAKDADLLVLNHALLMADIASGHAILPSFRHLILDEGHHVEEAATQNLGINLENWDVLSALLHLFRSAGQGDLPVIKRKLPEGVRISGRPPVGLPSDDHIEKLIDLSIALRATNEELFRLVAGLVESQSGGEEDVGSRSLRLVPALRTGQLWQAVAAACTNAISRLRLLAQGLIGLEAALDEMEPPPPNLERLLVDIQKQSGILNQSARAMEAVLLQPAEGDVTWIEMSPRRENPKVALRSAPINVGQVLKQKLFGHYRSAVVTSATLSVSGQFTHLKERLGLSDLEPARLATLIVSSPFTYRRQALLLVPQDLPNPKNSSERQFTQAVADFLRAYLIRVGGRSMVLFTSHRQLRQVYGLIKDELDAAGLLLLGQGLDGARSRLVDEFKTAPNGVLFGSASFWEGVDIPGEGLSSVILVKLPFMPPGDPVMEARIEDLERRGLSSFAHLSLPQAVIRFKQGFGRLIRTKTDRGVVIVLDGRVSPKQSRYGGQFLRSLPGPAIYNGPTSNVIAQAWAWLNMVDDADLEPGQTRW